MTDSLSKVNVLNWVKVRDSQSARDCCLSRTQDNTAPGSIALSFVNRIVKLPITLLLSAMSVS